MEKIVVSCLESRIDENQSVYSRFLLGPFLSGHAVTVATALRRALLSEVKNIAITALHIQGVTHEFSTVVGIRESVLELSLNFQQIILSAQTKPKSVQIGYLHVQGPAVVHANDLKLPDGIECVNPTQYIATLSAEGLLVVKFLIGEKKSFLKSNTSTLNSKKIKEAKAYSAQLSKSLLSHAEYDPPRLFRLLRNQSFPNGVIARRAIEEANLLRADRQRGSFEQPKGPLGSGELALGNPRTGHRGNPFDRRKVSSVALGDSPSEPNLVLKEQNLVEPSSTKVEFLTGSGKPTHKAGSVGQKGLEPDLEVPRLTDQRRDSLSLRESATIVEADSNLDQSANRISDEFNSEVCLRTIIPLDPIFTPVYQVNFGIERDDLSNQIRERVIMEVWTNGSIHPRQAINEAALSTMSIFSKLRKTFQLDSHSFALSANSTAPAAGFPRGSRLHKTKSIVKGGLLNDDATENLRPPARSARGSLVLGPSGQPSQSPARFARPYGLASKALLRKAWPLRGLERGSLAQTQSGRAELFALPRRGQLRGLRPLERECSGPLRGPEEALAQDLDQKGRGLAADAAHLRPVTRERFARVAQERRVNSRRFALAKPSVTKLDLINLVGQKLNSFSSLGFVRSRHPVSLFLQNFGKSHIRGQVFLLEQSFGLKARFFKGHHTVLSKAKYTSGDQTFKRTFLPSFKVVVAPLGANQNVVPSTTKAIRSSLTRPKPGQNRAGLTKAQLLFKLRFCLSGAVFEPPSGATGTTSRRGSPLVCSCSALLSKNRSVGRLSSPTSCPPARLARPSEAGQFAFEQQTKPKPILFLIKYRTFSFTRNALRIFGCKQEDSSFLLPLAKQLIRVKMARVFTSCLPLMSKRSEPSLRFRFTETQAITTVKGPGRFDVKQVLLSLARSALGSQNNSCGSENVAERDALAQNQELRSANGGAIETNGFVQASLAADAVSSTYGRQLSKPTKEAGSTFRLAPKGPKSTLSNRREQTGRRRPVGWQKEDLELRAPQKRIASSTALRAITPFGRNYVPVSRSATSKLWLRSNLKKQFGFFQFACNGLRAGRRHGFVLASRPLRGLERLGVCVNRTQSLTSRSRAGAVRPAKRSWAAPFDFTTFPLMMTKVPPLCLPSGLVTLIPSPFQEDRRPRPAWSVRVAKANTELRSANAFATLPDQVRRRTLEAGTTFRLAPKGLKSESAAGEDRRCFSAADLFGFNSDASVRSEFPFQLTTQAGTGFRLAPQGPKRLSILYSSNLDKMSFLSSDLANLSLSLKTYTFLKKKGKKNIASLLEYSPNTLFSLLNGDEKMFHEIERCLLFLGLPFKEQS